MPDILEFPLPATADEAHWQAYCRLNRDHNHELLGTTEWDESPDDALLDAAAESDYTLRRFLALDDDGTPVGNGRILVNHVDEPDAASLSVFIHPDHRRRGHGRALAERIAREADGFTRFETWPMTPLPAEGERVLRPSSGAGAVPADHPGVRLALSYGFALGQVERVSRYDVLTPAVDPADALAEAERPGADYEVLTWEGPADEAVRADLAVLKERMSTDVPSGDLTVAEQTWDAERVRRQEEQILLTGRFFRAAVRHRDTGRIVGVNELVAPRSRTSGLVDQWDTIVLPEHRGHRLGMRVKAANLVALRRALTEARAIITWNAEENRPMLDVNEALGFQPILVEAEMQAHGPLRRVVP